MSLVVIEREDLEQLIHQAVERAVSKKVPEIVREATRKEWLDTDELMEYTGWSRRTCQYLRDERKIPFSQDGRKILYPIEGIENFLEKNIIPVRNSNVRGNDG